MVCGCPIITTYNAGASWDLVKNGINGYVVKAGDVEQLCQSIKKVLCYSKLREKMREASRTIIRDISFEKSLEGYRAAIDYVLKRCEQRST
jgi:glycosyltransferase involved in cell wall biosynthesis